MLPCFIEGPKLLTVVIVPLIALSNVLAARCKILGFRTAPWGDRNNTDTQIFIVANEHAQLDSYRTYTSMMSNTYRSARMFIAELPLTGRWSTFSPRDEQTGGLFVPLCGTNTNVDVECNSSTREKRDCW